MRYKTIGGGGGQGGGENNMYCDSTELVRGLTATSGEVTNHIRAVTKMQLTCARPAGIPNGYDSGSTVTLGGPDKNNSTSSLLVCPGRQVATGIYGRKGKWLDQIGLVCGDLP